MRVNSSPPATPRAGGGAQHGHGAGSGAAKRRVQAQSSGARPRRVRTGGELHHDRQVRGGEQRLRGRERGAVSAGARGARGQCMRRAHLFEGDDVGMTQHAVAHGLTLHVQVDLRPRRASAPRAGPAQRHPRVLAGAARAQFPRAQAHRDAARDVLDGHLLAGGQVALQKRHTEGAALKVLDLHAGRDQALRSAPAARRARATHATHPLIALGRSQLVGRFHHSSCAAAQRLTPQGTTQLPRTCGKAHLPVIAPLHARTGAAAVRSRYRARPRARPLVDASQQGGAVSPFDRAGDSPSRSRCVWACVGAMGLPR